LLDSIANSCIRKHAFLATRIVMRGPLPMQKQSKGEI